MPVLHSTVLAAAFKVAEKTKILIFIACDMSVCQHMSLCLLCCCYGEWLSLYESCHISVMSRIPYSNI